MYTKTGQNKCKMQNADAHVSFPTLYIIVSTPVGHSHVYSGWTLLIGQEQKQLNMKDQEKKHKSKTSRQVHTHTDTDTHIQGCVCFRGCGLIGQQSLLVTSTVVSGSASGRAHPALHPLTADSRPGTVASTHTHTQPTSTGQYSCSANLQPAGAGNY